ncbi:MAG: exosortase-associated EpsI family protein [Verrucomicrobia bacterium]|nr:exosortase-associated EpsI family protein [Verrucomicrobiota bacterium]
MNRQKWILAVVALAIMAGGGGLILRLKAAQRLGAPGLKTVKIPGTDRLQIELPGRVLDFTSELIEPTQEELGTLPKDTTYGRRYYRGADGFPLLLSVVLMGTDRTSIHKPQFCLIGQGWTIDRTEAAQIPMMRPLPYSLPVAKLTVTKNFLANGQSVTRRGIYVYWFVADKVVSGDGSGRERMWWMAREMIATGVLQRWAYVTCFADCAPGDEEKTYERIKQFIAAATPEFQLAVAGGGPR